MKKSSKSSLNKRSLDISLQHKNEASYKFSKKNFCTGPKKGLKLKGITLSAPRRFSPRKKKKKFLMNCCNEESFYAREISLENFFQQNDNFFFL